jgi:hypothetical protein
MKINPLETHDRLLAFKKEQESNLFQGLEDCRLNNPNCVDMQKYFPYVYIFAHPRTAEDGATKRMLWQPRLTKPKAQTNSYLFRLTSNTDICEIIWLLPPRELWKQFEKGKVTASDEVMVSIANFLHQRQLLEQPHDDDWTEERIRKKLEEINGAKRDKNSLQT